jgi:hypothetical protein
MPLYRFCRPEDIPMIVQALTACYDVHCPERPATTVAQFREEMGLISLWPSNTMVVLDDTDPIAAIVGTKRLGPSTAGHRALYRRSPDAQALHHRPAGHQRRRAGGQ